MQNTGSFSSSPTLKDMLEPSARVNTPWMASGMVPPLILADAAVIVGLEVAQVVGLIQGFGRRSRRGLSMWAITRRKPSSRDFRPMVAATTALCSWMKWIFSPGA